MTTTVEGVSGVAKGIEVGVVGMVNLKTLGSVRGAVEEIAVAVSHEVTVFGHESVGGWPTERSNSGTIGISGRGMRSSKLAQDGLSGNECDIDLALSEILVSTSI